MSVMLLDRVIIDAIKAVIKKVFKSTFASQTPISRTRYVIGL